MTLSALLPILSSFVDYDTVPVVGAQATCEMARELLVVDRTAVPPGEGIESVQTVHATHAATGTGSSSDTSATKDSKADTRPIISHVARALLGKFGALISGGGGAVRLVRS